MTRPYLSGLDRIEVMAYIAKIAADEHPVTIRHLFYRATSAFPDRILKTDSGYNKINRMVNEMRFAGGIKWDHIRDSSRSPRFAGGFRDMSEFLTTHANLYRVNAWEHVPDSVTVWCESESAMGMIDQMCARKGVDLYPCRGHASNDFVWRSIRYMHGDTDPNGTAHILYVGDWDKEGREIPEVIERKLTDEFRKYVDFEWTFTRLAINEDQIHEFDLPQKPGKHADLTVELEAMPAPTLRGIISDEIDLYMPEHVREHLDIVERDEREGLQRIANVLVQCGDEISIGDVADRAEYGLV